MNAGDIGSRVKQLDETTEKQQEGEGEKSKAGFWEEFDVRVYLTSYDIICGVRTTFTTSLLSPEDHCQLYRPQKYSLYTATLW